MRKYFITLVVFMLSFVTLYAKTAVVFDFDTEIHDFKHNAAIMSDMLRAELVNTGKLDVIDRKSMDIVIAEMQSQQSDYRSTENIKQLGKMLNADYVVLGSVSPISNTGANQGVLSKIGKAFTGNDKIEVVVRILEVETLKVISSVAIELEKWTDFSQYTKKMASDLVQSHVFSSEISNNIKTAREDMLYGVWEGDAVHDGIIDTYTVTFKANHKVLVDIVSTDKNGTTTQAKGSGRFIFNDNEKILTVTVHSLSGNITHLKGIQWKSCVNPSKDASCFNFLIPATSRNSGRLIKVDFYRED